MRRKLRSKSQFFGIVDALLCVLFELLKPVVAADAGEARIVDDAFHLRGLQVLKGGKTQAGIPGG